LYFSIKKYILNINFDEIKMKITVISVKLLRKIKLFHADKKNFAKCQNNKFRRELRFTDDKDCLDCTKTNKKTTISFNSRADHRANFSMKKMKKKK
jgi:hypothetical protein